MLSLDHQIGQFTNFNPRPEKHGPESVPGADLKISMTVSNDVLSEFHPTLKSMLFREPNPGEEDLVDKAATGEPELNRLRFGNKIGSVRWHHEIVGADLTIHYGTGKNEIELSDVTVDGFVLEPMDGGSVVITFRVKCNPNEKQGGATVHAHGRRNRILPGPTGRRPDPVTPLPGQAGAHGALPSAAARRPWNRQ